MLWRPQPGDPVTCRIAVEAYYSNYGITPELIFKPGMIGIVVAIAPKVFVLNGPGKDRKDEFVVVEYYAHETQKRERVGLNFCNTAPWVATP